MKVTANRGLHALFHYLRRSSSITKWAAFVTQERFDAGYDVAISKMQLKTAQKCVKRVQNSKKESNNFVAVWCNESECLKCWAPRNVVIFRRSPLPPTALFWFCIRPLSICVRFALLQNGMSCRRETWPTYFTENDVTSFFQSVFQPITV